MTRNICRLSAAPFALAVFLLAWSAPAAPEAELPAEAPLLGAQAQGPGVADQPWWEQTVRYIGRHARLGTRWLHVALLDDKRKPQDTNGDGAITDPEILAVSYMGSINQLDVVQDDWPDKVFAQWEFCRYVGVEVSYEHIQAKTVTYWDGHTDGTFDLQGPMFSLYGALPNRTPFTPRAGVGVGFLSTYFDYNPAWHNAPGITQYLDTDDASALIFYVGCSARLVKHLSLDIYARQMNTHVDAHYYMTSPEGALLDNRGWFNYPMENRAIGVGLRLEF